MAFAGNQIVISQTPIRKSNIPAGLIVVSIKWKGLEIVNRLKAIGPMQFSDSLGLIDFQVSSSSAVVYLTESDAICGDAYKNTLHKIRKANSSMSIVVIVEKTSLTEPYFKNIQNFIIFVIGLKIIPVASAAEAAQFLHEMSIADSKSNSNPFRISKLPPANKYLVKFVQEIPGIDEAKAEKLLQRYSCIKSICNASKEDLATILGTTVAQNVRTFLVKPTAKS